MTADPTTSPQQAPSTSTGGVDAAQLYQKLAGPALLDVLNVKSKPSNEVLQQRVVALRNEVLRILAAVPEGDPSRGRIVQRLDEIQRIVDDPLEWHILVRAHAMRLDPSDADVRARLEASFLETHVPRAVWLNAPTAVDQAELRKAVRLPLLADVDVEIAPGQVLPMRTENLSRSGLGLCEVPPSMTASTVKLSLQLPGEARRLVLNGKIAWRRGDRVGVQFVGASVADELALDKALQGHFAAVRALAERYLSLAPKDPTALACASMARFFATVLPNERAAAREQLNAHADEHPAAAELQLACARLAIEAGDLKTATKALRRAEKTAKSDPRWAQLEEALAKKSGAARRIVRAIQTGSAATKAAAAAVVFAILGASTAAAFYAVRGPYEHVELNERSLPCIDVRVAEGHVLCNVDVNTWNALGNEEKVARAEATMSALAAHTPKRIVVSTLDGANLLMIYDGVRADFGP